MSTIPGSLQLRECLRPRLSASSRNPLNHSGALRSLAKPGSRHLRVQAQAPNDRGGAQATKEEFVDTRIHWDSPHEGWIEGDTPVAYTGAAALGKGPGIWPISRDLVMAIMEIESTHYRVLGVTPTADMETVKSAYRRLSKLYHPDTTELPVELAEQKFVQLREAYSVLSSSEQRRLYDWKIASESSQRKGNRFVWPYEVDASQRGPGSRNPAPLEPRKSPVQSTADEDGNVPLSDGSMAALTFDIFAVVVSISVIALSTYFKSQ